MQIVIGATRVRADAVRPPGARPRSVEQKDEAGERTRGDEAVRCAACGHALTSLAARIEVGGAHQHTFMNPAGFVFTIGCWAQAPGCRSVGPASTDWSWFDGAAWRLAVCAVCGVHVGWSFSRDASSFHGLIVDRTSGG